MRRAGGVRVNDFVVSSLGETYPQIHDAVMRHGDRVPSRAGDTMNLKNVTIALTDPWRCIVARRGMSYDFALEETCQALAGVYSYDRMAAVNERAAQMITPSTAYGPRVWPQLELAEAELRANPNTRRATVYVGRPDDLALSGEEDRAFEMPCTKTWQFDLTSGALDMTVEMRSNDAVWGLSYDVPMFTSFQRAMARALGVEVGTYWHKANSFHVYERHFRLELEPSESDRFLVQDWFGDTMRETKDRAAERLLG